MKSYYIVTLSVSNRLILSGGNEASLTTLIRLPAIALIIAKNPRMFFTLTESIGPLILKGIYQPHRPSIDDLRLIVYGREADVLLLEQPQFTAAASKWLSESMKDTSLRIVTAVESLAPEDEEHLIKRDLPAVTYLPLSEV